MENLEGAEGTPLETRKKHKQGGAPPVEQCIGGSNCRLALRLKSLQPSTSSATVHFQFHRRWICLGSKRSMLTGKALGLNESAQLKVKTALVFVTSRQKHQNR